jgi:hypothetical protein
MIPVNERFCEKHSVIYAKSHKQDEAERQKRYDTSIRHVRDAKFTAFYHSQAWIKLQPVILTNYHKLDLWAYYVDHAIVAAEMVHHIRPVRTNWEDRFSVGNLIPLSDQSHGLIEQLYKTDEREQTQHKLLQILEKWDDEFGGRGS